MPKSQKKYSLHLWLAIVVIGASTALFGALNMMQNDRLAEVEASLGGIPAIVHRAKVQMPSSQDIISYSLGSLPVSVDVNNAPVSELFDEKRLQKASKDFGRGHAKDYYLKLFEKGSGSTGFTYNFKYQAAAQDQTLQVTIIPNFPHYASMDAFNNDFNYCEAGGKRCPAALNENWLMFEDSCGGAAFEDLPLGCNLIQAELAKSLKLNLTLGGANQ